MNAMLTPLLVLGLAAGLLSGISTPVERLAQPAPPTAAQDPSPLVAGAEHARLQSLVGTWKAVLVLRDPTGTEHRTEGTLTTVRETDFHTSERFQGTLMGMAMVGHGINGYCPVRKRHYRLWTDSMTPTPMVLWGDWDGGKRELVLSGECQGMSGKLEPCRTVTRFQDDDHVAWTLFGAGPSGEEIQYLRIEYTRKK